MLARAAGLDLGERPGRTEAGLGGGADLGQLAGVDDLDADREGVAVGAALPRGLAGVEGDPVERHQLGHGPVALHHEVCGGAALGAQEPLDRGAGAQRAGGVVNDDQGGRHDLLAPGVRFLERNAVQLVVGDREGVLAHRVSSVLGIKEAARMRSGFGRRVSARLSSDDQCLRAGCGRSPKCIQLSNLSAAQRPIINAHLVDDAVERLGAA